MDGFLLFSHALELRSPAPQAKTDARPHIYKDLSEQKTFRAAHHLFDQGLLPRPLRGSMFTAARHTIPSMLAGSLRTAFHHL